MMQDALGPWWNARPERGGSGVGAIFGAAMGGSEQDA